MQNKIILLLAFILIGNMANAQKYSIFDGSLGSREFFGIFDKYDGNKGGAADGDANVVYKRNIFKINASSLGVKTYSVQYERVMNQRASLALGLRFGPESAIFDNNQITDQIKDVNPAIINALKGSVITNYAITPEAKIYFGKGFGKGFYVAPFGRYENFDLTMPFTTTLNSGKQVVALIKGTKTGFGGGMLLGWQIPLAKFISLDYWIIGPYIGPQTYNLTGDILLGSLTANEQTQVREIFEVDNPLAEFNATVTANKISIDKTTSIAQFRTGLCLGIKF